MKKLFERATFGNFICTCSFLRVCYHFFGPLLALDPMDEKEFTRELQKYALVRDKNWQGTATASASTSTTPPSLNSLKFDPSNDAKARAQPLEVSALVCCCCIVPLCAVMFQGSGSSSGKEGVKASDSGSASESKSVIPSESVRVESSFFPSLYVYLRERYADDRARQILSKFRVDYGALFASLSLDDIEMLATRMATPTAQAHTLQAVQ